MIENYSINNALIPVYWDHDNRPDIFATYHNGFHRDKLANLISQVMTPAHKETFINENGQRYEPTFVYSLTADITFRSIDRSIIENFLYPIGIGWWIPPNNNWVKNNITIDDYVLDAIADGRCKILLYNGAEGWDLKNYWYCIVESIIATYTQLKPSDFIISSNNANTSIQYYNESADYPLHIPIIGNENLIQPSGPYNNMDTYRDVISDNIQNNSIRKYRFMCLNRRPNLGRFAITTLLSDDRDKGLLSFSVDSDFKNFDNISLSHSQSALVETYKNELTNQDSLTVRLIRNFSNVCPNIYRDFELKVKSSLPWFIDDGIDVKTNPIQDNSVFKYTNSYLNIVTETVFSSDDRTGSGIHLSEKSFKPIWFMQPFVIVGVPGALKSLRDIGYETFSQWIDESYDSIQSAEERVYSLAASSKKFYNRAIDDINRDMKEMLPVLLRNQNLIKMRNVDNGYKKLYEWKSLVMSTCFNTL